MGLILKPSEIKSGAGQMRSRIESTRESYHGALQVVQNFSQNETLQSKAWDTVKSKIVEAHQHIVMGILAVQDVMEQDLSTLEENVDGMEDLYEDDLIMKIQQLTEECKRYEIMIKNLQTLQTYFVPSMYPNITKEIANYRILLEKTKEELELIKEKLLTLQEKARQTSELFQTVGILLNAIEDAINDAEVYISGTGQLSEGEWKKIIPKTISNITYDNLKEVLQKELDICIDSFEELYGEENIKEIQTYALKNNIYNLNTENTQKLVIKILEQVSECSVTVVGDKYQLQAGNSTIIREFSFEKIKEKLKVGSDGWDIAEVIIPETVEGSLNGKNMIFNPLENWGALGKGAYGAGVQKDTEGRYKIAVAPKIIDYNYPDNGKIWGNDFTNFSNKINLVLEEKNTGERKIIECIVTDYKAHSYNKYPDGHSYITGDTASFNIENGLIQTGISYPNSVNAEKSEACSPRTMAGSVIEFAGHEVDFKINDYRLKAIVILEG